MPNFTAPFTRALNKQFRVRCKVTVVGSFIGVRIEDPDHTVTVYDAQLVAKYAYEMLLAAHAIDANQPASGLSGTTYHMGGIVLAYRRA
jgi:hypothetical protein